jgi:hypothetical protein
MSTFDIKKDRASATAITSSDQFLSHQARCALVEITAPVFQEHLKNVECPILRSAPQLMGTCNVLSLARKVVSLCAAEGVVSNFLYCGSDCPTRRIWKSSHRSWGRVADGDSPIDDAVLQYLNFESAIEVRSEILEAIVKPFAGLQKPVRRRTAPMVAQWLARKRRQVPPNGSIGSLVLWQYPHAAGNEPSGGESGTESGTGLRANRSYRTEISTLRVQE